MAEGGKQMPRLVVEVGNKKFVWDGEVYSDKAAAAERKRQYQMKNFEAIQLDECGGPLLYVRKATANVTMDGGMPS
jgi:hypothetical protein